MTSPKYYSYSIWFDGLIYLIDNFQLDEKSFQRYILNYDESYHRYHVHELLDAFMNQTRSFNDEEWDLSDVFIEYAKRFNGLCKILHNDDWKVTEVIQYLLVQKYPKIQRSEYIANSIARGFTYRAVINGIDVVFLPDIVNNVTFIMETLKRLYKLPDVTLTTTHNKETDDIIIVDASN